VDEKNRKSDVSPKKVKTESPLKNAAEKKND
jgi:hypothetical protein